MSQRRTKWRFPLGTALTGIAGAALATAIAVVEHGPQAGRRELAVDMQQEFRRHGLHYTAVTAGASDTVLLIETPTMTRHFAEFLVRDPAKGERLGNFGFTAIVFANKQGGAGATTSRGAAFSRAGGDMSYYSCALKRLSRLHRQIWARAPFTP